MTQYCDMTSTDCVSYLRHVGYVDSISAGNYLRYKYLDTYFRYFKSILYLVSRYIF